MKLTSVHAFPLAYFLEVARLGSLSAASQTLHVAVSAISRQVARLEEDLGVALFEREARGMRLTAAGQVVQQYARRAYLDAETLRSELQGLLELARSTIRVACSDGFAHDYLPYIAASFQRKHPGVVFSIEVREPAVSTRLVREGVVDLALTFSLGIVEGVHAAYSETAPVYAHVARTHPLAQHKQLTLKQVIAYPLVLPNEANTIRQLFDLTCELEGLRPNVVMTSSSLASLIGYQHYAEVVSLCGSLSVRNRLRPDRRVLVPISNPEMRQRVMQVQTMVGREQSPAVSAFLSHLIEDITGRRRAIRK